MTSGTSLTTVLKCQCRTKCCKLTEDDAGLNFSLALRHLWCLYISLFMIHVHVHASCPCCTSMFLSIFSPVHHRSVCVCEYVFVCVFFFVCINAGMPDCPGSDQSGIGMKKLTMPGMVLYRTEIINAVMPMPALVSSMLMPSYVHSFSCCTRFRPWADTRPSARFHTRFLKL